MVRQAILFILASLVIALAVPMAKSNEVNVSQSPEPTNPAAVEIKAKEICNHETPCMWSVYTRFTRVNEFNMSNHCMCPPGKECLYYDDDISINAYVYRCYPLDFL